ncbi:hypothetical protein ACIPL1_27515 [Pseudomonas sp. NPDC090202]|uniref:hypothetical protein n=1 Tax=unclassified Pseudomonas TaxID=196821 RepID=UPI0038062B3D
MKIMASISGYAGEPVTLLAFLDPANGILAIAKKAPTFRDKADEGYAFITNRRTESYDCLFTEEHMADAIRAYLMGEGSETIKVGDSAARYKPRIETDGVTDTGQKYRLHPGLSNGEVAVLALAHFQQRQGAISNASDAMDEMYDLFMI